MPDPRRKTLHPALWLVLPAWIVVFAALVPTVGILIGEGVIEWYPLEVWELLSTGFWNAIQPRARGDHDMFDLFLAVLAWTTMVVGPLAVPILQWMMLMLPVVPPKAGRREGTSLTASVLAVGLMATVLTLMPLVASIDLLSLAGVELGEGAEKSLATGFLAVWVLSWPIWTIVLLRRAQGNPDRLERFISNTIKGTAVGTGLAIPWYALMRSREGCYCALGSYWSLVMGLWALLMLGGPLLLVLRRRRRSAREPACRACFHPKDPSGAVSDRCPECGRAYD